jgi:YD repeat-containing protein
MSAGFGFRTDVMAYDAFVSYSHAADGRLAPALQLGLQRLAKPWYRVRALRVFRDETGLSTNPDLWSSIVAALDEAEWFVLLASPESATSLWVDKEVAHWLEHKPVGRILPAVTAGEWAWDPAVGRLVGDAVPERLAAAIVEEPRHLDLRWAQAETDLDLRNSGFRSAIADLAAPMHGVAKDELEGEDIRQHRRARRVARSAVTALVLLTGIAVLFGIFAARERDRARRQATVADSQRLAAQAQRLVDNRLDLALLLAVEARTVDDSVATRGALEAVLSHASRIEGFVPFGVYTSGAFRPDGRLLALARPDGTMTLQDLPSGRVAGVFADGTTSVSAVAFSSDGDALAMGHQDGAVAVRDLTTGTVRAVAPGGPREGSWSLLDFSPDGRRLAGSDSRGNIVDWDLKTSATSATVLGRRASGVVSALAWSSDSRTLAALDSIGTISVWNTSTRHLLRQIPSQNRTCVQALTFLPDGHTLAAGTADGRIALFDVATGRQAGPPIGASGSCVSWFALSPDGATLAVANAAGTVSQWDSATRTQRGQPPVGVGAGTVLGVLAAHGRLVTGDGRTIAVWRLGTGGPTLGRVIARLSDGSGAVFLSRDGSVAFMGALNADHWDLFDVRRGQVRASYPKTQPIWYAAWSPDDKAIAIGLDDGQVRLVDPTTGATLASLFGHHGPAVVTAFSPDGRTLAAGGADGTALVWDVATHRLLGRPLQVGGAVYGVAFSPDGKTLAVASEDGKLTAYDLATHRRLYTYNANGALIRVAFSPDGNTLAVAGESGTLLLDAHTGRPRGEPLAGHSSIVIDVAYSSSGHTLATASLDGTVILYDVASRQAIGDPLNAGYGIVADVSYTPDGRTLAAAYGQGQIVLWDINPDAWQPRACALAGRNLTRDEWHQYLGSRPYHKTCPQWPAGG